MKEGIKELIVKGVHHEFVFDEQVNKWRSAGNEMLIQNYSIDLLVDPNDSDSERTWKDVTDFIGFLYFKPQMTSDRVERARPVIREFFRAKNKKQYNSEFFQDLVFKFSSIHFHGHKGGDLIYDFYFYPQHGKDNDPELSQPLYVANFKNIHFIGVTC
ncbi:hypothetical protein A4H97_30075 [Niastella yeongjuensis]|uniref:Uncharacterized protein n=1 Tax=Niastella yeongjuensis TaxID=354355 RepID=A0A1V9EPJ3_9BACT|nr:hypothetical protein [Niastella yeongjuensis]OQP48083.1 hypothetical protein A4H97_30075 [Niastella yeongjuensis]SEO26053.1 hypothetical protein SAMN05660816_02416 [Niastella yeongjuensis]